MNLKEIKEFINLMNDNDIVEFEVEREGVKIRIRKSQTGTFDIGGDVPNQRIVTTGSQDKKEDSKKEEVKSNLIPINAPMVGTFYRAPSPDSKSYVEIGDTINVGQVICIVEAMKLMNEIKSEVKGKLVEVLIENASSVEYGQALFMVEPI